MKQRKQKKPVKPYIRIGCVILAVGMLATYAIPKWSLVIPVVAYDATADKQAVKKMEEELAALRGSSAQATQDYEDALAAYKQTEADILAAEELKISLDKEIAALETEIDKTNELLNVYNEQLAVYEVAVAEKETEIEERYQLFIDRVRINYEDSFTSYLEIVLSSENFSDLLYRVDIVASLLEYDKRVLKALDQSKQDLTALKNDYQALQYSAQQTLEKLSADMPVLEEKRKQNEELIEKLEADFLELKNNKEATEEQKAKLDAQVKAKAAQVAAAEAEIDRKIKEAEERERLANYVGGQLGWPVDIKYNTITSTFSNRINPVYGYYESHNGIDIPVPYGSAIYAANAGTVIVSEYHYSYGYYVVIDHGGRISTLYGHNSKLLVSVGDQVTKGQQIAKAGSTGTSTGNHCHFTVRENGVPVNPMNYVVQP
ncbi:MAG: peptidoglycan DD-metalloendopeptidase family protein [Clostridia bacterium]|nr:peptidoglycan DD-metalloendopeptidase family protein [Clostridia bacterium]